MTISYSKLFVGISLPALCTGLAGLILCSSAHAQTIRPSTQKELKVFDPTASATGNVGIRAAAGTVSYTLTLPAASPSVNQVLSANAVSGGTVSLTWATPFSGTGTTNYLSKFASAGTLTNSLLFDNGTNVGIGSITPNARLEVRGAGATSATTALEVDNSSSNPLLTVRDDGNVGIGTTSPSSILHTIASGAKTANYIGNLLTNTATSSTVYITKTGLSIESTGTWNGSNAVNRGLHVNATGGAINYAAIFESGNVGIGTTSPSRLLEISFNTDNSALTDPRLIEGISIRNASTNTGTYSAIRFDGGSQSGIGSRRVNDDNQDLFIFSEGGSFEKVTFKANGRVGIGTTNPSASLEVRGAGSTSATTTLEVDNSSGTSLLTVRDDGNVGIGTTSPALKLHIKGVTGYPATSGTSQTGIGRFDSHSNSNVLDIGQANVTPYGLWLQGTDRSDLSFEYPILLNPNGGNVGIGTTSPGAKLEVASSDPITLRLVRNGWQINSGIIAFANKNGDQGFMGVINNDKIGFSSDQDLTSGNRTFFVLDALNDRVGIGTASPNNLLSVAGTLTKSLTDGTGWGLMVEDTKSQAAGVGGGIIFRGYKIAQSNSANFGAIAGIKENGTSGNELGALAFYVNVGGSGVLEERFRINNSGVKIGTNGTFFSSIIRHSETKNNVSLAGSSNTSVTFTVSGALVGATVFVSPASELANGILIASARVSSANTVIVQIYNDNATLTHSNTYNITVINP
jgi:hypothetical protein